MRDLSLILATVGRTSELNRLFDSLIAQSFRNFEVIVVDQNHDERLLSVLQRARSLGIVLKHLRHHPPNLALARNTGIAAASGTWLGFPDDDCWYEPPMLDRIMLRSRRRDAPRGVICRWVEQDAALPPGLLSWQRSCRFRDIPVSSITLFFQRSLVNELGGFDGRLGVGQWFGAAEETDIVLRALRAGAVLAHEPAAHVHHKLEPSHASGNAQARKAARHRARGTGALYAKHKLPLWVILRGLTAPVLRPLLKGRMGAELAHGMAVTRGRLDGWLRWSARHPRKPDAKTSATTHDGRHS